MFPFIHGYGQGIILRRVINIQGGARLENAQPYILHTLQNPRIPLYTVMWLHTFVPLQDIDDTVDGSETLPDTVDGKNRAPVDR